MGKTITSDNTPDQFSICNVIPNLATVNFKEPNGNLFCIDNENEAAVLLSVKFARMDTFVTKKFYPGPNPYLIKEIAKNTTLTAPEIANLKYGY